MMNKTMLAILKVLDKHEGTIVGSRIIAKELTQHGVELTERTVRYHLRIMDERGLSKVYGKEGRKITGKGKEELSKALVSDRVGFILSKIENLSFQTKLDLAARSGEIVINISLIYKNDLARAVRVMRPVFASPYVMSNRVIMVDEGGALGEYIVPEGMVGMGTVCSVTINGILLKEGIPVASRYGGLLELEGGEPARFVALISYEGSSLDPLLVFIKSGMTSVTQAVKNGNGKVLASFREIPVVSSEKAAEVRERLNEAGIGGIVGIGSPNQPLYEVPVSMDRTALVVVGGLNPLAALNEAGIQTDNAAMAVMVDYRELVPFNEAVKAFKSS